MMKSVVEDMFIVDLVYHISKKIEFLHPRSATSKQRNTEDIEKRTEKDKRKSTKQKEEDQID